MKRMIAIVLSLCLAVTALAGCGSTAPAAADPTAAPASEATA